MPKFVIYPDKVKEWRWRIKADNGKIIGDSGEGYKNKVDCEKAINLVKEAKTVAEQA